MHAAIAFQQFGAESGQRRTAALFTAALRFNNRLPEHMVQRIHQQPCATIGHVHRPPRGGDGTRFGNQLHQFDLAVPETLSGRKIDTKNRFQWRESLTHRSKAPSMKIAIGLLRSIHRQRRGLIDATRHRARHHDGGKMAKFGEMNAALKRLFTG
ncbi:hypothetical protein D3C78_1236070 [compost metagenome]